MKGLFITFEGVDGCGKSTQMRFLSEYLTKRGIEPVLTREPGGCNISEQIRDMVLDIENREMGDRTEALLYAAARAQHVEEVVRPAVKAGKIVLCDRFIDSSLAYQGVGRGLGIDKVMGYQSFCDGRYDAGQDVFSRSSAAARFRADEQKTRARQIGNAGRRILCYGFTTDL